MVTESDNSPVDPPPQHDAPPIRALDPAGLPAEVTALFDVLPNVMFCVKGADNR